MALWEAKGKTFVITGGASGMGARYPELFLEQGAKNIALLDIAEDAGKELVEKLEKTYPGQVIFIKCDMSKEEDITKAFEEVLAKFKQIDVIINNAGIMVDSPAVWRTASDVNYQGVVSLSMKGINHMDKSEGGAGGTIVNIASMAALRKVPVLPIYSGAKSGVLHFCRSIATGPFYETTGVRIMCMCFGGTDTPLLLNFGQRVYNTSIGAKLAHATPAGASIPQKIESAIASVEYMLKNGASGSVWASIADKPAKDITSILDRATEQVEKEINE